MNINEAFEKISSEAGVDSFNSESITNTVVKITPKITIDYFLDRYAEFILQNFLKSNITFDEADDLLWNIMAVIDYKAPQGFWNIAVDFEDFEGKVLSDSQIRAELLKKYPNF